MHSTLSVMIIAVAIILLIYMIVVESEPGAVPLLLLVLGIGWYLITRARIRAPRE